MRRRIRNVLTGTLLVVGVWFAVLVIALNLHYLIAEHKPGTVRVPVCASEDSPNCVWIDPDTGHYYYNDEDRGKPDNE